MGGRKRKVQGYYFKSGQVIQWQSRLGCASGCATPEDRVLQSRAGRNEERGMGRLSGSISLDIWVFVLFGQWTHGVSKTGPV